MLMDFIHFVYILSLVCWVGSIVFFSFFTAPVIFKLLDREKAGEVVGVIFPRYYFLGYVCAVMTLLSLLVSTQELFGPKQILLFIMIVGWFYAGLVVSPKSRNLKVLRQSASSAEEKKSYEVKFKKIHSLAVKLNGTVLFAGLGLLWFSAIGLKL
ncbi:DUF4149 domain-containing protein [Nitrospinaceae bacterium]|nr:DUF4149 domain-containing protein [Nitrospinaceae bacterium]